MTDVDHFQHYKTSSIRRWPTALISTRPRIFSPNFPFRKIAGTAKATARAISGSVMDGHYHSIIVLTRWPQTTYPGIIHRLTNLRLLDYTITVNVDPLPIRQEINKEEKEHDRVAGDYASEKKLSLLTVMEKKQKKIHALMQGHTLPFKALFVIRVWDKIQGRADRQNRAPSRTPSTR